MNLIPHDVNKSRIYRKNLNFTVYYIIYDYYYQNITFLIWILEESSLIGPVWKYKKNMFHCSEK